MAAVTPIATSLAVPSMPDIANTLPASAHGRIDRVGMEHIELPIRIRDASGLLTRVPARADIFVSLDAEDAKGIHMSRLFLAVQEILGKEELTPETLRSILDVCIESHADISRTAALEIRFDHLIQRAALKSRNAGWKSYPIRVAAQRDESGSRCELGLTVAYSSTCPCSAALSRQLVQRSFLSEFGSRDAIRPEDVASWLGSEEGMCATPHSQRSYAELRMVLADDVEELPIEAWIDASEDALGTPVQAAVKREDEQAFAALNGSNLMFCEDAARRLKASIEPDGRVSDYRIKVRHEESLHPHDAVSILCKGIEGGMRP